MPSPWRLLDRYPQGPPLPSPDSQISETRTRKNDAHSAGRPAGVPDAVDDWPATAQETPPADLDERVGLLFHIGMTALTEAEQADSDDAREKLYDKAIAAFRMILVNRPELIRVRLELARTFFLRGRDGLARRHFELVLAGGAAAGGHQHL